MKLYSSKSNAKRSAIKAGLVIETSTLMEIDGKFAYLDNNDAQVFITYGAIECPHCSCHLDNGVDSYDNAIGDHDPKRVAWAKTMKFEFVCMACNEEFGEVVKHEIIKPAQTPTSTGLKIEKDREEKNGITKPSIGGACRLVWDACDGFGSTPSVKDIRAIAEAKKWNMNNTVIEYYNWRKFHGITGRVK